MSAISQTLVEACRSAEAEPVSIPASELESTAPEYLRTLKYDLASEDKVPAVVECTADFGEDCSFATQEETERLREYVRAASFLGAGRVDVAVEAVANPEKVEPALQACAERARREGVSLTIDGPVAV